MKIFILNFQRSGVKDVIQTLQLQSLLQTLKDSKQISNLNNNNYELKEIPMNDFFNDSLYAILKEVEFSNSNPNALVGGGGINSVF